MAYIKRIGDTLRGVLQEAHIYGSKTDERSRRYIIFSWFTGTIIFNMVNGSYLAGYCLAIGGDANYINLVVLILSLSSVVQLVSPLILERIKRRKPILITLRVISRLIALLIVPLLALTVQSDNLLWFTLALLVVAQMLLMFTLPGIQAWQIESIPVDKRVGFFSFYNVAGNIVAFSSMFLASLLVDHFVSVAGASKALPMLWMLTLFIAALDMFCLLKVHEHPYATISSEKFSAQTLLRLVKEHPEYMKIVAVVCIMSFASSISSQYYVTFLLSDVGVSYTFINSVNLINIATMLLFTKPWKKKIDANPFRKNLFLTYLLFSPHVIGLFFVSGSRLFLYPLTMFYACSISVGLGICNLMFPYVNLPEKNRTVFLALFNTTLALATFPGILTGRILFGLFSQMDTSIYHPSQLLVLVWGATLAVSAFLARWLMKEKRPEIA